VARKVEEEGVNLREAIKEADTLLGFPSRSAVETILAAAKRELEREDKAGRVRRASLSQIEEELRCQAPCSSHQARNDEAADILKALREKVVPWLRRLLPQDVHIDLKGARCGCCHRLVLYEGGTFPNEILRALGEEL
jgi:hypothetical protein